MARILLNVLALLALCAVSLLPAPEPALAPVTIAIAPKTIGAVTWAEVAKFLEQDTTNLNQYDDSYVCADFAADLVANAHAKGISAWSVAVLFTHELGHSIVAFETTDKGVVYVEPQTDGIYSRFAVGKMLCEDNEAWACIGNGEVIRVVINE